MQISKQHLLAAALLAAGFTASQAQAGCDYPSKPDKIPNGEVAALEEMKAAGASVKKFTADIDTYIACIDKELADALAAEPKMSKDKKANLENVNAQKANAANDEKMALAAEFNTQRTAYLAKNPPAKK
jgi:hypothetical protein